MKTNPTPRHTARREGERGAALITALLISTLLLLAGGALLVKTTGSNAVAFGSTAEMQAYYSAEAGLQSALNVLRGNVENADETQATFRNAVDLNGGNLNAWLAYDKTINGKQVKTLGTSAYSVVVTDPDATAAPAEPSRLLITSTGYGPRGSRKQVEMLLDRTAFDFTANSTLLMRGADDCSDIDSISIGQSNAKEYNGNDASGVKGPLPVFGTTCGGNKTQVTNTVNGSKPNTVTGNAEKVADVTADLMPWLQSADAARALLIELAAMAASSDRYFTSTPADYGSDSEPKFTFVDGDADLRDGTGLLVVTGTLSMSGNANFNGIILVLGEGAMTRNGGGNGDILGAVVVAKFDRTWPADENDEEHPFLSPTFQTNGGGNSTVQYDSVKVDNALKVLGFRVFGVQEK
jgi:hypothetical protein